MSDRATMRKKCSAATNASSRAAMNREAAAKTDREPKRSISLPQAILPRQLPRVKPRARAPMRSGAIPLAKSKSGRKVKMRSLLKAFSALDNMDKATSLSRSRAKEGRRRACGLSEAA